jgi:hypothetical protein
MMLKRKWSDFADAVRGHEFIAAIELFAASEERARVNLP